MRARLVLALAALALGSCASLEPKAPSGSPSGPFKVAITIDDLPVHGPIPAGMTATQINRQMVGAITAKRVSGVTGFVNGRWVEQDPANMEALKVWQSARIPLANHTWSHPNLNDVSTNAYKQEIVRNEPLLQGLNAGQNWKWFRYPFLGEGNDPAKRAEIRSFLADRGYRIAAVSMDFSDWQYGAAYARCRDAGNTASLRRMEDMYLDAAREHVHHSRRLMKAVYGRDVPLVQLMHVGALSAHMMPRLIDLYRSMGARFVSLAEAQSDPVYAADNNPRLPPRSQSLGSRAQALGAEINPPQDRGAELEAMCR